MAIPEYTDMEHFPLLEDITKVLQHKTGTTDPHFFRILVAYALTKVPSMMRAKIKSLDLGTIPINMYAINLASSGHGKNKSANILDTQVLNQFTQVFMEQTFPSISETSVLNIASKRSINKATDQDEELKKTQTEFNKCGNYLSEFDSGTSPAFKQLRHKCLMAEAGSLNFIMDELGSNLISNTEMLNVFLEAFDAGLIKQKLIKNTADSVRNEEIIGSVPANMMLFGTPMKVFDGAKTEEAMDEFLGIGFARRCFFGLISLDHIVSSLSAAEIFDLSTNSDDITLLQDISDKLGLLADRINFNRIIDVPKNISILLIEYRKNCELRASLFADHEETKKAEMIHRYFKTLKVAGTFAFINGDFQLTEDILFNAIKLTEESGASFHKILNRDRPFVKLAKYIASVNREVTHVDLVEDLPFYKGNESMKRDMMTLAIAYGYQNNIIIKRSLVDGIEFMKGESLELTDLDKVIVSYSTQLSDNYKNDTVKFTDLAKLTQKSGYHWTAHHVIDGHRREASVMQGVNLVVIDIDDGVDIATVKLLMQKYTYHIHTTKRHTSSSNRCRLILPMSHVLKLDKDDYKEFMANIYEFLPFSVDEQTNGRERKWLSYDGDYWFNDGELLDSLLFIPKTAKNDERKQGIDNLQSFSNIERWFLNQSTSGNRNNTLIKYALVLVDMGKDSEDIEFHIKAFNSKLPNPLSTGELNQTIFRTVDKKLRQRMGE